MSAATAATSSGAAEAVEEALMVGDDAGNHCRIGRRVPLVELERAAEDDPVGPGEHVARAAGERILDLGLRLEDGELAAGWSKLLVAEQVAAAEAGAVEDEAFRQCSNAGRRREFPHFDLAAGNLH